MRENGFTLIEVIVAMAIIAVVTGGLTMALVSGVRNTAEAGERTQAVRILDYIGRHVSGGTDSVLAVAGTPVVIDYGDLGAAFGDLAAAAGVAAADRYRTVVTNTATLTISGASTVQYDGQICYAVTSREACVRGTTLGPAPATGAAVPPLPGVN